ncbi:porin [Sphingomonas hankyongi]|uniref:Porin n=1 Tax=Sphingomonas hankyongi TaxID=2908209 RepID=A0ABT0S082_9SPHN|nr:porin [Sphingomonas hankyongi]MCL6729269.1 porin [Sphingomonas hankyongi]
MKLKLVAALLASSALTFSAPAWAQDLAAQAQPEPTEPDQSDATADQAIAQAAPVDDAEAKIELMQAQIEALQDSIEQLKAQVTKVTPSWKGAPQYEDKEAGWSFKPKGLLQYDAGYVGFPDGDERRGTVSGLNYGNLGWNTRARRLTIGADGTIPGGFRYSAEFNFAQSLVDFEDVFLAYDFKGGKSPLTVQAGYFYPFSSLETMTSSKYTSFMERAGITDAFSHNRRIGAALIATDKATDRWTFQSGIFSEEMNQESFNRTGWVFAARGVFSPNLGSARLHLGANFEHRTNKKEAQSRNYQARPMTQITDQRFISTGALSSKGDDILGLEVAAILKSFHVAAEAQKVWVRGTYTPAEQAALLLDPDTNTTPNGTALNGNPGFWGGYFELGYYLTGETRAYKGGSFGRVKVLHPFNEGGWGAFQINGRVDYLDLNDRVADSATVTAPNYVNGGKQVAYQLSGIWNPTDYVRLMAQYSHINVTGGPRFLVSNDTSEPANKREFDSDVFTMRAQIDF